MKLCVEDLVEQRSGDPLLIYASMPVILALKKKLSEAVMGKVSFLPIKNSSRPGVHLLRHWIALNFLPA